jgi:hypothetical protein
MAVPAIPTRINSSLPNVPSLARARGAGGGNSLPFVVIYREITTR